MRCASLGFASRPRSSVACIISLRGRRAIAEMPPTSMAAPLERSTAAAAARELLWNLPTDDDEITNSKSRNRSHANNSFSESAKMQCQMIARCARKIDASVAAYLCTHTERHACLVVHRHSFASSASLNSLVGTDHSAGLRVAERRVDEILRRHREHHRRHGVVARRLVVLRVQRRLRIHSGRIEMPRSQHKTVVDSVSFAECHSCKHSSNAIVALSCDLTAY